MLSEKERAADGIMRYLNETSGLGHTSLVAASIKDITQAEQVVFIVHDRDFGKGLIKRFGLDPEMVKIATLTDFIMGTFTGTRYVLMMDNYALYQLLLGLTSEISSLKRKVGNAEDALAEIRAVLQGMVNR